MDLIVSSIPEIVNALRNYISVEYIACMIATTVMLYLEVTRRAPNLRQRNDAQNGGFFAACKKFLQQYAPEAAGLTACLSLAVYLRIKGSPYLYTIDEANQAFAAIIKQWPILLGADSLLAIQSMLRLLVYISNAARAGSEHILLSQEPAAISFGAALGRVLLFARSRDYMLDGPLGGYMPVVCEVLSMLLLAFLCRGVQLRAVSSSVLTLAVAASIGYRNRLALSNDVITDGLFIFAHTAELFAAFAYLSRALLADNGIGASGRKHVALRFTHLLMPVQQCLSAYYFVQAFDYVPELIAAGHPFEVLQMGGVAQVGAFAGAAVLHLAEYLETSSENTAGHTLRQNEDSSSTSQTTTHSTISTPRHSAVGIAF